MYVVYNCNSQRYLYADADNKIVATGSNHTNNGTLDNRFVWRLNKVNDNQYLFESMSSGYIIESSSISDKQIKLTENASDKNGTNYFTASNNDNYIRFQSTNDNYYMAVNNNNDAIGHKSNSNNSNRRRRNFYLYEVVQTSTSTAITHEETIPIKVLDNKGESQPITAIHRNDFIEILVSVTYNEKTGSIEFEVSDWNKVDGEITFD